MANRVTQSIRSARSRVARAIAPASKAPVISGAESRSVGGINLGQMYAYMAAMATVFGIDKTGLAKASLASVWAWRCIDERSRAMSRLPIKTRRVGSDKLFAADGTPFVNALEWAYVRWNQDIIYQHEMNLCVFGENYEEKLWSRDGRPAGLRTLNPLVIEPQMIYEGKVEYYDYSVGANSIQYKPHEIGFHRYIHVADDVRGLSPLTMALDAIGVASVWAKFLQFWFANGTFIGGIISAREGLQLDERQIKEIIKEFKKQFAGARNVNQVGFLPFPVEFQPFDVSMPENPDALNESERRIVCATLRVPMAMVDAGGPADPLSANATLAQTSANWAESFVDPEAELISRYYNTHIMPWLDDGHEILLDTSELLMRARNTVERSQKVLSELHGGIMTLNQSREKLGYEPVEHDMWYMPFTIRLMPVGQSPMEGKPMPATPFDSPSRQTMVVTEEKPAALDAGAQQQDPPLLPAPRMRAMMKSSVGSPGASAILPVAMTEGLIAAMLTVRSLYAPDSPVRWSDLLHVTLYHTALIDEPALHQVVRLVHDQTVTRGPVAIDSYEMAVWDKGDHEVLVLLVAPTNDLLDVQRIVYDAFASMGAVPSEHSSAMNWRPHITLGYAPPGFFAKLNVTLPPICTDAADIHFSRTDFEVIYGTNMGTYASAFTGEPVIMGGSNEVVVQPTPPETDEPEVDPIEAGVDELRAWEKFHLARVGKSTARPFEPSVLDAAFAGELAAELVSAGPDRPLVKAIFSAARAALESSPVRLTNMLNAARKARLSDDALAATLERFEALGMTDLIEGAEHAAETEGQADD